MKLISRHHRWKVPQDSDGRGGIAYLQSFGEKVYWTLRLSPKISGRLGENVSGEAASWNDGHQKLRETLLSHLKDDSLLRAQPLREHHLREGAWHLRLNETSSTESGDPATIWRLSREDGTEFQHLEQRVLVQGIEPTWEEAIMRSGRALKAFRVAFDTTFQGASQ